MSLLRLNPAYANTTGSLFYRGRDILALSEQDIRQLRRHEFGLIPQSPSLALNPFRHIGGQLQECFDGNGTQETDTFLRRMGFSSPRSIRHAYSFELSGGMNQRVVSIFGMANAPDWIIADEPTKGLDSLLRRQVINILRQARDDGNHPGILLITHDIPLARAICDDAVIMHGGRIVEQGGAEVLRYPSQPYTRELIAAVPGEGFTL